MLGNLAGPNELVWRQHNPVTTRVVNNAITFPDTWNLARVYYSNHPDTATNHVEVIEWWS